MRLVRAVSGWRGASKMRLPLARGGGDVLEAEGPRQEVSWSRLARRPPTLIARRKATWRGTGRIVFTARRSRRWPGLRRGRVDRAQEGGGRQLAPAGDEDFVPRRRLLCVPAEETAEVMCADDLGACRRLRGGELTGLEPVASAHAMCGALPS